MSRVASFATGTMLTLLLLSGLAMAIPAASAASTVVVSMPSGAGNPSGAPGYSPDKITVIIGVNNTVEWTNNDTAGTGTSHTVNSVAGNGTISSGNMPVNTAFTYTFTSAGTYNYYCLYHSWMTGTVVVKASTTPSPEFPDAALALVLFAVIAAVVVVAPRLRPNVGAALKAGT